MIIIHEEIVKNPNEEVNKLIDDFVKTLKSDDIDIKEVSYNDKIIFLNSKADYEYATYLLDHEYTKEKQLGIRVGMYMAPGLNYDIPDPVMMDEDLDRNDDSEEILVENEPDYPQEQIEDALRVLGYIFKGYEVDGRLITTYNGKTSYFDDFTDAQDFILNMYLNDKDNEEYKWAYDVLVGNKTVDDYWESDYSITESSDSSDKLTLNDLKEYTVLVQGMFDNRTWRDDCIYALEELGVPYITVNRGSMSYWLAKNDKDAEPIIKTIQKHGHAFKNHINSDRWNKFKTIEVVKYDPEDSYAVEVLRETVTLNEDDYSEEIQNAIDELQATTSRDLNNVKKRISFTDEFDNGRVTYSWNKWTPEEAELKAKEQSLRNPDRIYYVIYDGVGGSNIHWQNGELLLGNY